MQDAPDLCAAGAGLGCPAKALLGEGAHAYQKRRMHQLDDPGEVLEAGLFDGCHFRSGEMVGC